MAIANAALQLGATAEEVAAALASGLRDLPEGVKAALVAGLQEQVGNLP